MVPKSKGQSPPTLVGLLGFVCLCVCDAKFHPLIHWIPANHVAPFTGFLYLDAQLIHVTYCLRTIRTGYVQYVQYVGGIQLRWAQVFSRTVD